MTSCWKCNKEVPENSKTCPHCAAPLSRQSVEMMATIGPGGATATQIVPGVLVNNRYDVICEIGRGGMGIVYLAHDRIMEQDVAMKVIPQELCLDPNAVADLKKETAIALTLTHPNIVRLHTLDTWEGQAFVVMEYVGGGTLAHKRSELGGKCSLEQFLPFLEQLAAALDYSHSSSPAVVHRDLKPLNILLTASGDIKIADFGLARVLRDSASRVSGHDSAGTLAYMAPEQIRGKGVGKKSDLYALAAITYEMLSGHPPFSTGDLRWQIMHEEVEAIEGLPEHVNAALLQALDKEPENRPENAAEFVQLLKGEKQVKHKTKKKRSRKQKSSKSGFPFFSVFVVLLLIAGAACGAYYFKSDVKKIMRGAPVLTVESNPAGAMVSLDGAKAGEAPVVVSDLPSGTHQVRLTLEKYQPYEKKILIQPDSPIQLKAELTPEPFGDLRVESTPSGAEVFVDGKLLGETPVTISHIDAGVREVKVSKDRFITRQYLVEIKPLTLAKMKADLISSYGRISVTSNPTGAAVYFNGEIIGETPIESYAVRKGLGRVEVKKDQYEGWSADVKIFADELETLNADLVYIYGNVSLTSNPSGALVQIDGREIGITPLNNAEILKGRHKLDLSLKGYKKWSKQIDVRLNTPLSLSADLERSLGTLKLTSTPSNATVKLNGKEVGKTPFEVKLEEGTIKAEVVKGSYYTTWVETLEIEAEKQISKHITMKVAVSTYTDPVTGMEFVYVEGGCYQMGDTFGNGVRDEKPVHEVCIDDFYIGKYEVTQGEYNKIMRSNPAEFKKGDRYPVEKVSWNDAQDFIRKLKSRTGKTFRLPTEAEWEYAARSGGKQEEYAGASSAGNVAWYTNNSGSTTHQVGTKQPNSLGIYDMSGNVWEWCSDWYDSDYYSNSPRNNPQGPSFGESRVLRGGSWNYYPNGVRIADRYGYRPEHRFNFLGLRLVLHDPME